MVGEAANYRAQLVAGLSGGPCAEAEIIALPREAAFSADFDAGIGEQDVVISLRLRREGRALPAFRLLHVPGAGLDGIDFDALAAETTVCNVYEHEGPISEFVLASILNWEIRLDELRGRFSSERWSQVYRSRVPHGELAGKTIGIIGFGRIGRAVAKRATAFGMTVVVATATPSPSDYADSVLSIAELPQLLAAADYLVIACPLSPDTRGMIAAQQFALMKPETVLVNVSRAEIIDEAALFEALDTHRIRGASLDVWYRYPSGDSDEVRPADHPFDRLENAVCTPHSSAWTTELMARRYAFIARNINALATGMPLENVVRAPRQ